MTRSASSHNPQDRNKKILTEKRGDAPKIETRGRAGPHRDEEAGRPARPVWIRYLSTERRELWNEHPKNNALSHCRRSILDAREWQNTIDAVFATRLPQTNAKSIPVNDKHRWFSLKVFPDFGVNGTFKGVIQIVEALAAAPPPPKLSPTSLPPPSHEVRSIFEFAHCGIIFYKPETDVILSVNKRFAQETGYAIRELPDMPGRLVFGDGGVALLRNIHQRMIVSGGGVAWGQDFILRDRLGREEIFFCSLVFAPPEANRYDTGTLRISLEGTERDDVTGAVRYGPNPRFIFDALQDGIWEYDAINRLFFYGQEFTHIFGEDGLQGNRGKTLEDYFHTIYPGDSEMVMGSLRRLLKDGEHYRIFYRVRDRGGNWHWIFSSIHAILNDSHGHPSRIIGFHVDISVAMQTENNLVAAEEKLRLVFENSGVGIILADQNGIIYRINPAMVHMFGRDAEDMQGRELSEFAHPESKRDVNQSLSRLMHSGRREIMQDLRLARPDGREIWVNSTFSLSRKGLDGERYIVVTGEDVTTSHLTREKLQYEATHDVMTGAWNRWVMFERLEQHIHLSLRHNQPMAFCLCDLDFFKMVNDIHGHQMGDWVLIRFVELLKESLRDTDVVARYGGEEFGVIFPLTTVEGAAECIERFLSALRMEEFGGGEDDVFSITATVGVSGIIPGCSAQDVVSWSDVALYQGKETGRNRVVVASPPGGGWLTEEGGECVLIER